MKETKFLIGLKNEIIRRYNIWVISDDDLRYYNYPHCKINILDVILDNNTEDCNTVLICY